jgi:7,8-dihydroneopterin aldolase/epimerase/oxygenase
MDMDMDKIRIVDLEVFYQVGVTDEERSRPQRLLITLEINHDFTHAIAADNLADTIDYFAVSQRLLRFGEGCHWQLIETLADDIATMVMEEFRARSVAVEVKKFVIPQASYVAVCVRRNHP